MTDEPDRDLMHELRANLAVLDRHFIRAMSDAENEASNLSEFDSAVGNVLQLVNLLVEDYGAAWDLFEVARTRVNALEAQVKESAAKIIRPHLIVPG